jgi:hypothetical protein
MNEEIRRTLEVLTVPGQVVELRALSDRVSSGYFDDRGELARIAGILDNQGAGGVYITLNPVSPALLSRRANRIKQRLTQYDQTTADGNIVSRRWFPVDIDPVRPSGISSSDEEHEAAMRKADEIAAFLRGLGFPDPVHADSGNGAHLLCRIDLPNDTASGDLVSACLSSLDLRFSDETCRVDTANANAARIWKLYGTVSRKGDSTPARPHRRSKILSAPGDIIPVSPALLARLASLYPQEAKHEPGQKGRDRIDLRSWLGLHLPGYREKPYLGGTLFVLDSCPFSSSHRDGAYAIQFRNGAIYAGCHHDSCGGGIQRWQELRDRYEHRERDKPGATPTPSPGPGGSPTAIPKTSPCSLPGDIPPDPAVAAEAERVLRSDHPLRYMLDTFAHDHEGDQVVAECLIMSLASRSVINSKGLHVSITGESGKGKSHTMDTILRQVPPSYRLFGRISEKALFYITGMQPGTVIALDDHALSDQMQEILKGVTSSFHRPFTYHTVSRERTGQVCTIPERCVWWMAKVEGTGDDQVFNRMLTCWIDDSDDLDRKVLDRTLEDASRPPTAGTGEREEVLVCREIWNRLDPVHVIIPYAQRICFHSAENRRNPDMLLDLVRSHAVLMQAQREEEVIHGTRCIMATEDDFHEAARLFTALNSNSGGQVTKLTRREAELVETIHSLSNPEVTVSDLQQVTGLAHSTIHKLLNGYLSRGVTYSGLLEKCPAVSFLDRTITTGADGGTTQRRVRVYTWDPVLYRIWKAGGSVWLALPGDEDGHADRDRPGDGDDGDGDGDRGQDHGHEPGTDPDPPVGGVAGKDGSKQHPADLSRPENPDDTSLIEKIEPNYTNKKVRAGEFRDRAAAACRPGTTEGTCTCRSPAHGGTMTGYSVQNGEPGLSCREESPARTQDPSARAAPSLVDPGDFVAVDGWPQKKPCIVCGRKYTQYQERMTRERMADPPRPNRMLCTACFKAAQVRVAMSIRTIPGVTDTKTMHRRSSPNGRCTICNTGPAIWSDPGQRVCLCDTCYQKEGGGKIPKSVISGGGRES